MISRPCARMILDPVGPLSPRPQGRSWYSRTATSARAPGVSVPEKDFPMYLRWHREGKFRLDKLVTRQYKLDDANQAVEDLAAGRIAGRAIIVL